MSWLSSALSKSKVGRTLNAVAKPIQAIANPIVDRIPVVGAVKQGLEAVGDYVPGAPKTPSLLGLPEKIPIQTTGMGGPLGGANSKESPQTWQDILASALGPAAPASGSPNVLGQIGDFLTGNKGMNALGIAQGVNAAMLQKKSGDYANKALGLGMQQWNAGAPLRAQGLAGLTAPKPIDLAGLDAQRRVGNPFAVPSAIPRQG